MSTLRYNEKVMHINQVQGQILNADCKEMYCVIARGGGKTNVASIYEARNMHSMPRCMRLLLGPSYRKVLTDLLPGIMMAWERLGYYRDVHYVIGNSPIPKKQKWLEPYFTPPEGYRNFMIHWYTGAALRIGSTDRKVTLNGLSLDGITADELKLQPEDIFNEVLKVNRANPDREWSHLPEHNSVVTFTDKYWTRKNGDWVMKKKKNANPKAVRDILILQAALNDITQSGPNGIYYTNQQQAASIIKLLHKMRNETTAFFEAPVYVNIPAISPAYILQMKRNMPENEFRASMLNHDLIRTDGTDYFYPLLSEEAHGYYADNHSRLDNLEFDFDRLKNPDSTFDTDLDSALPIEISCDWGGTINCLVVAQQKATSINIINSFYAKHPEGIKQLADKFCQYYRLHKHRQLNFYYDPSGNNKMPNSSETVAEEFARYLREQGWIVAMMHLGMHNNPRYELRYELFNRILAKPSLHDTRYPYFYMNRSNCREVFISMLNAPLKKREKKLLKDKSSEKAGSGILPEHATNFSDAVDYLVMHKYGHLLQPTLNVPSTMAD